MQQVIKEITNVKREHLFNKQPKSECIGVVYRTGEYADEYYEKILNAIKLDAYKTYTHFTAGFFKNIDFKWQKFIVLFNDPLVIDPNNLVSLEKPFTLEI